MKKFLQLVAFAFIAVMLIQIAVEFGLLHKRNQEIKQAQERAQRRAG